MSSAMLSRLNVLVTLSTIVLTLVCPAHSTATPAALPVTLPAGGGGGGVVGSTIPAMSATFDSTSTGPALPQPSPSPMSSPSLDCPSGSELTFELITGHVYSSPADTVTMLPGVLHLSECLEHCRDNFTCRSLNFETGLCVLLSSSAMQRPFALTPSQFPVFTIYAHKICLKDMNSTCAHSGWAFERVRGFELREHERRMIPVTGRVECMQACLGETRFTCRSANYEEETKECWLSDMNRNTINVNSEIRSKKYGPSSGSIDYLENNCVEEPKKLCDFKPVEGKILKTVDSVYQDVKTPKECEERCLRGGYKCHSYDFGDPSNPVCRTSHLDKVALAHIENPYIEISGATTYELHNCYDVTISCRSKDMVARVRSSKIFDGKLYAKRKPHHCATDVSESLEFEIKMNYNDLECDVREQGRGQYSNDIVIQHHDMIVTTSDLGLNVNCRYDLSNKSITNNVNLAIDGALEPVGTHSSVVGSPNVTMSIADEEGASVRAAKVGDSLVLRFEITDDSSPYQLFVRELIALDGTDMSEFMLIDTDGCPTDLAIMKPIEKRANNGHVLETQFEAFKFPTSDIVQFKALITPCVDNCEPSKCSLNLPSGRTTQTSSFGRRRRRRRDVDAREPVLDDQQANVIVVESLSVTDKFTSKDQKARRKIEDDQQSQVFAGFEDLSRVDIDTPCLSMLNALVYCFAFLAAQLVLLILWSICWSRRWKHKNSLLESESLYVSPRSPWPMTSSGLSSLSSMSSTSPIFNKTPGYDVSPHPNHQAVRPTLYPPARPSDPFVHT